MSPFTSPPSPFQLPGFRAFWLAETVSGFGTHITTLALQVLVVLTLQGTATDVGLVNAARWVPYLLFGLVLGALIDRRPRRPVLIVTDLGRAALLAAIPALWALGLLSLPILMAFVALFGLLTLMNDAATQSFLPRLVPSSALVAANARLDQGAAVAQGSGPLIAGGLIGLVGAPLAVLADAATYLISAITLTRIRVAEPPPLPKTPGRRLWQEIGEGVAFVYRHRTLAPFAIATHAWFLFHSMAGTVLVSFALTDLGLGPTAFGAALAAGGAASLAGALIAEPLGRRLGAGRAVIAVHALKPFAWLPIVLAPAASGAGPLTPLLLIAAGQALYGFAMGAENANSMGYRQAVTPDALQGRMNTTMRSLNRAVIIVGAPLGGLLADALGARTAFWIAIVGFALVPTLLALSPYRNARIDDGPAAT